MFVPHGKDWDSFVHSSIQLWEKFYIKWIKHGKDLSFVYFDDLASGLTENTLKKIMKKYNIRFDENRLKCVLKHKEDIFKLETSFINKNFLDVKTRNFKISTDCDSNETYTFNIYTRPQMLWINSAIRNVKIELRKRGYDSLHLSNYENGNIRVKIWHTTK